MSQRKAKTARNWVRWAANLDPGSETLKKLLVVIEETFTPRERRRALAVVLAKQRRRP